MNPLVFTAELAFTNSYHSNSNIEILFEFCKNFSTCKALHCPSADGFADALPTLKEISEIKCKL